MKIKELTKKRKLNVLNKILELCPKGNCFLCLIISNTAWYIDYITDAEYNSAPNFRISIQLIPELLQFKPETKAKCQCWFDSDAERVEALKKLIKIIEEQ
jgi:hypothetical protein